MDEEPHESRKATIIARVCGALVVVAALIFVIDLLEGPFFSLSTRTWVPEHRGDRLIGGIEGAVKGSDSTTSTVRIASGFLGLSALQVVITPQTQIAINGKLGGFADLDRGQLVRVAYEVLPDRLVAWRVDVLDRTLNADGATPERTPSDQSVSPTGTASSETPSVSTPAASTPPSREPSATARSREPSPDATASREPSAALPPRESSAAPPSRESSSDATASRESPTPTPTTPPSSRSTSRPAPTPSPSTPSASMPSPRSSVATTAPPPRRTTPTPSAQIQEPRSAPAASPRPQAEEPRDAATPAAAPRAAAGRSDRRSDDGGDAIDWLLKDQRSQ